MEGKDEKSGKESVYTTFQGNEVMFHVSTLLPHSTVDEQQIAKKRFIGNDIVVFLYKEKEAAPICPRLRSQFNRESSFLKDSFAELLTRCQISSL